MNQKTVDSKEGPNFVRGGDKLSDGNTTRQIQDDGKVVGPDENNQLKIRDHNNRTKSNENNQQKIKGNIINISKVHNALGIIFLIIAIVIGEYFLSYLYPNEREEEKNLDEKCCKFFEEFNYAENKKLTIAIDFGNIRSRFSYTFDNNINDIKYGVIQPTVITLYSKNNTYKNYGIKTINSIINYTDKEKNTIMFCNNLKYNFFDKINSESKCNNTQAIIEYLTAFSDGALKEINSQVEGEQYIKEEVNWVITVPSTLDESYKLFLIVCAKKSGLKNINLALESEAASLSYTTDDKIRKKKGEIFMSVDLGGYKIDITINELLEDGISIRQLSPHIGMKLGSMNINNDILKVINKIIFNNDNVDYSQDINNIKTLEDIEKLISSFSFYNDDVLPININNLRMKEKIHKSSRVKEIYYGNNYKVSFDNSHIYLPSELINEIIQKRINEVVDYIKNILEKNDKVKISRIIFSGGLSRNNILRNVLKKRIKGAELFFLMNEEYSVVKGALIYQINKNLIRVRKHNYIYGYKTSDKDNKNQYITKINQKEMNSKNDLIQKIISSYSSQQDIICFLIYRTEDENFEKNEYVGNIILNITEFKHYNMKIKLKTFIQFSTYLNIYAIELKSNKTIEGKFLKKYDL